MRRVDSEKKTAVRKRAPICLFSSIVLLTLLCLSVAESRIWIGNSYVQNSVSSLVIKRILFEGGTRFSLEDYSTKADMYMNHFEGAWKIPKIHALNPNVTCLLYRNARAVYTGAAEYRMFLNNGWILKDPNGTLIRSTVFWAQRIVDVGNPSYQQWVANWLKGYLDKYGYNGVFLDDLLPSTEILWSTSPSPAINPRTGKAWTDEEFKQAVIALVNRVKDTIGNKPVIGNGIWQGERFFGSKNQYYVALLTRSKIDGIMSEGLIMDRDQKQWYSESKWKQSIDMVAWLENNFLNKSGRIFLPVAQNAEPYNGQGESLPSGTTKEQYALYAFASLLLGASSSGYYLNFGFYVDDFSQSLFKIDIGSPLGAYYMVGGTHVYARDFSKVKALINPTDQSYTVNLDESYQNFDGTLVEASITMLPHTGRILKKVGRSGDFGNNTGFFAFDDEVDGFDLGLFIQCYNGLAPPDAMYLADMGSSAGFFEYDGVVDGIDLALFMQCYYGNGP